MSARATGASWCGLGSLNFRIARNPLTKPRGWLYPWRLLASNLLERRFLDREPNVKTSSTFVRVSVIRPELTDARTLISTNPRKAQLPQLRGFRVRVPLVAFMAKGQGKVVEQRSTGLKSVKMAKLPLVCTKEHFFTIFSLLDLRLSSEFCARCQKCY